MTKRRRIAWVVAACLALLLALDLLLIRPVVRLSEGNRTMVVVGMTEAQVVAIMGEPHASGWREYSPEKNAPRQDVPEWSWYADQVRFYVLFDADGRVVAKRDELSRRVAPTAFHRFRAWLLGW